MDWGKLWNDIVSFFKNNIWNIVLFFAVLFLGIIVIKLFVNILKRILNKTRIEKIAVGFIVGIVKVLLYLCLVLSLLSIIGIEITGILTALSAAFLAVGLALQNNIANMANGIIIVSSKMFKKGDYIKIDGSVEGSITQINFLYTTLMTPDNKKITIPNSTIVNSAVIDNDTMATRRVELKFSVSYESDVEEVKKILLDCALSNGKVLLTPEPFCRLNALKDSSIEFVLRVWVDKEDYWSVYYDLLELAFNELKRKNISIPYNQLEIRERTDTPSIPVKGEGLPQRVEKERVVEHHFDLENASLAEMFSRKSNKNNKKTKTKKEKEENAEKKYEERATKVNLNENANEVKTFVEENKKEDK